jgi:hypothetical protein
MTWPDSSNLAQDRTDAATCMEAAILFCGQPLMASTSGRMIRALGQLLNAVGLALAADGRSVPPTVRRAALQVADQLQRLRSASSGGVTADNDHVEPPDQRSAQRHRNGASTTRARSVPYTTSIKLGRMA